MPELDRRDFLKLVGAGAGAATAAGCSDPVEKLIPYVVQPERITPGLALHYASTCRECSAGCGIHARTREGRAVKLEGNPENPVNRGALCARGQSGIGRTYHPDRFRGPQRRGADGKLADISWDEAIALLAERLKAAGNGTYLLGRDPGPTASELLDRWVGAVGAGGRVLTDTLAPEALRAATSSVFGVDTTPVFDLSQSDLIVSLGSDFLETGLSPTEHQRQLAEARDVATHPDGGARFVYVGPRLSMTASSADEWIAAKPGTEGILALALARVALANGASGSAGGAALGDFDPERVAARTGVDAATIEKLGKALAHARSPVVLPPTAGLTSRRAAATASAVLVLNNAIGAVGHTLQLPAPSAGRRRASYREVLSLIDSMKSGRVSLLLVHDANPVYSLPAAEGFAQALEKVPFVVSFASMADETTERADLVLPDHTPLESWGDAQPRPGVRSLMQPVMRPLFDTRGLIDTLLDAGRALGPEVAAKLPAGSFRTLLEASWSGTDFRAAQVRGGVFDESPSYERAGLAAGAAKLEVAEPLLEGDGEYVLLAHPSPLLSDGYGANLPWLQEIPDPVSKITWQSWVEISNATAEKLGVVTGDVVAVETPAGKVEVAAYVRGGIRDDVVALALGQGHRVGYFASQAGYGHPGVARGVNVGAILPAATDETGGRAFLCTRAKLTRTGRSQRVAFGVNSDNKRDRLLGETVELAALGAAPHAAAPEAAAAPPTPPVSAEPPAPAEPPEGSEAVAAAHGGTAESHEGDHEMLVPYDPSIDARADSPYRWGMSIDLDRCTGCSACVAACYVENNVPVVGEDQVIYGRLMAWLRIERYAGPGEVNFVGGRPPHANHEKLGDTDIRHSPMLCQQCGAAPCEPVCPVIATYHNPEGLNGMVYNRCIGTRYCSNNCPYKVRRFNWYDFNLKNWPEPMPLMLNPEVSVRGQGVMEKCTFCVQRIAEARQPAKDEKRVIRDGEIQTACQQACASHAIQFGNTKDPESQVVKNSADPVRGYHALHELNTRPAITYLAKVRRGTPEASVAKTPSAAKRGAPDAGMEG